MRVEQDDNELDFNDVLENSKGRLGSPKEEFRKKMFDDLKDFKH